MQDHARHGSCCDFWLCDAARPAAVSNNQNKRWRMRIFIAPRGLSFDCRGCCHILCKSLTFLPGRGTLKDTGIVLQEDLTCGECLCCQVSLWENSIPLFSTLCTKRMGSKHFVGPNLNYFRSWLPHCIIVISVGSKSDLTVVISRDCHLCYVTC